MPETPTGATTVTTSADGGSEIPELVFRTGMPGFPGERHFALVRWGASEGPYSVLVDVADPDVRFLVAPPEVFFPSYEVEIDDATAASISLESAEDALVLVIITLAARAEDATANLLGPLVINTRTLEGVQAVLAESENGTRVPLVAA